MGMTSYQTNLLSAVFLLADVVLTKSVLIIQYFGRVGHFIATMFLAIINDQLPEQTYYFVAY